DAVSVKSRLHQSPLPQIECALTRQESISQQQLRPFKATALGEIAGVGDEDVLDELWVVDEEDLLASHAVRRHVTVGSCERGQKGQRIPGEAKRRRCEA